MHDGLKFAPEAWFQMNSVGNTAVHSGAEELTFTIFVNTHTVMTLGPLIGNTTARTAEPYVKQFIERRELNIYIAIDISSSSNYGSVKFSKRRIAAIISAIFSLSAAKNGDKVGLILFSDSVEFFSSAKKGSANCMRILREVLLFPSTNKDSNPGCALEFLLNHQSRKSLILLASDFFMQ